MRVASLLVVAALCLAFQQAAAASRGKLFAVVAGVTNYSDRNLPGADLNARKFYDALRRTFPKSAATIHLLTNQQATVATVKSLLEKTPSLEAYSVFIFYFSGHGTLRPAGGGGWSDTYLLLSDGAHANAAEEPKNGLNLRTDVVDPVYRLNRGVAMIFLDCCHSGAGRNPLDDPDTILARVRVKAFLLGSCAKSHETQAGVFTDALVQAWTNAPPGECWTTTKLEEQVQQTIKKMVSPAVSQIISPRLSFGSRMNRCIARLNEASSMVVLNFTNGLPKEKIYISIDGTTAEKAPLDPDIERECYYPMLLEKKPGTISLHRAGNPAPFWSTNLTKKHLETDVVIVDVGLTNQSLVTPCDPSANYTKIAEQVEAFGADAGPVYYLAASALPPDKYVERATLLARATLSKGSYGSFFQLASTTPVTVGARSELFHKTARQTNSLHVLAALEDMKAYEPAVYLCSAITYNDRADDLTKSYALYRQVLNCRIAGATRDLVDSQQKYFAQLAAPKKSLLERIRITKPNILVSKKDVLPGNMAQWRAMTPQDFSNTVHLLAAADVADEPRPGTWFRNDMIPHIGVTFGNPSLDPPPPRPVHHTPSSPIPHPPKGAAKLIKQLKK